VKFDVTDLIADSTMATSTEQPTSQIVFKVEDATGVK